MKLHGHWRNIEEGLNCRGRLGKASQEDSTAESRRTSRESVFFFFFFPKEVIYLIIWLCQALLVAHRIFSLHCSMLTLSCSMWI